jgi:hypothetical protein
MTAAYIAAALGDAREQPTEKSKSREPSQRRAVMNTGSAVPDAAKAYAARGWPVFPVSTHKRPLTPHGLHDATCDADAVSAWWTRWPSALIAIATGEPSGIVALDIDLTDKLSGWDSLDDLGCPFAPESPMAHTPRGGTHCLFVWPGHFVKTIAGRLGPGVDVRGDGGSLILPPGPGRYWDPHYNLASVSIAPMPSWMHIQDRAEPSISTPGPSSRIKFSRYGEAALDNAVKRIINATAGEQEMTLNAEVYSIARLADGGAIPPHVALEALTWAASQMPTYDGRRPWRRHELDRKVRLTFTDGLAKPRGVR